ncbi:MAG: uridine diphosphate-N-acetylglucosamine-binding protein YvcK [Frankiaceae bacterium]
MTDGGEPAGAPRVVALGGGHGLATSLAALRTVTTAVTAVVTVADDGGSSGRLRAELGVLPPGDLRMALAALTSDGPDGELCAAVLQHRFGGDGALAGHPVGNLLLAGLIEVLGNPVAALDALGRLLGVQGRVLPVSCESMDIVADVVGVHPGNPYRISHVHGQVAVATTTGQVVAVRPIPPRPTACPEAVAAIAGADFVVLGPGSWFSSVLPHLLVPDILAALAATKAHRILVLNLAPQVGETSGFTPETHLEVLAAHAPGLTIDIVLADPATVTDVPALGTAAADLGARLVLTSVGVPDGSPRHDVHLLAAAYRRVFAEQVRDGRRPEPVNVSEGAE